MANAADQLIRRTRRAAKDHGLDLATVSKQLDKTLRKARRNASDAVSETNRYIRGNPWTSMAIAAGTIAVVGIAVAVLLQQQSRPRRLWRL